MEFLVQILEFIKEIWNNLLPFFIVVEYEDAIILRFGKYHRTYKAGIHWKIPFIDQVLEARNTITTLNLRPQSLTTKDGQNIVIAAVIKYQVIDAKKFLIEVEEAKDALGDIAQSKIKDLIINLDWEECKKLKDSEIKAKMGKEPESWGIKLILITITDLAIIRSIRLIQ